MSNPIKFAAVPPAAAANANANTYSDARGLAALKGSDPHSPQALRAVAQQVDALFLQMMLKSMRDANAAAAGDSNEMGMYQDMFDKQISLTMSQHQDLGLGSMLTRQIAAQAAAAGGAAEQNHPDQTPGTLPRATAAPSATPPAAGTAAPAGAVPATSMMQAAGDFVDQVLPMIRSAAATLGVAPLGLLAQAALETGWGKRMARTADGKPSLNLFGIKADENWSGARAMGSTVEYSGGAATLQHAAFRAYGSVEESVQDFAKLLQSSPRYRQALAAGSDAREYVQHLGRSGYATDPRYADKLNEIMSSPAFRSAVNAHAAKL